MSDDSGMKAQTITSNSKLAPLTNVTDEELRELQTTCAKIVGQGGETGAIASDIMRISAQLRKLSEEAKRCLGV